MKICKSALTAIIIILSFTTFSAYAQRDGENGRSSRSRTESTKEEPDLMPLSYSWKLIQPLGLRELVPMDTLPLNYYRQAIPSMVSTAWATTGNLGAEGMNMIYSERKGMSDFFFRDALEHWMPTASNMRFYNTRIPITLVSFNSSGGRENAQERLKMDFSGNINEKAQIGAKLDYLYSKGSYANQATKDLTWGLSGSYMGDRYELQAFFNHYNLLNKENGGITDMLYITDPAELQGGVTTIDPKSIPTNLRDAHTRLKGEELYINNRYKVGYWKEEYEGDSITSRTYIPVSSFIYTLRYNKDWHLFVDDDISEVEEYFGNKYINPDKTYDDTGFWSLTNTLGASLLEGFNKYAKFGLSAYVTHQIRRYTLPVDSLDHSDASLGLTPLPDYFGKIEGRKTQNLAWAGAQLTKQQGSLLRYEATGEIGILGPVAGDLRINGRLQTRFPLFGDSLFVTAFGSFRNEEAPFLMKNYISNHFIWYNDFGKERTVNLGGSIDLGRTGTHLSLGVTNVQNHIYFDDKGMPRQHGGNVQVLSISLLQNLKAGIMNWDNKLTYQTTSDDNVIPLPNFAVRSNLYLLFNIATLNVQLGVDCDYYTRYYSPIYVPATTGFANQRTYKVGNYPFCNLYANFKLSRTRFYVLYSHANKGLFGGSEYFSMPFYPLNPSRFQIGIAVDFVN